MADLSKTTEVPGQGTATAHAAIDMTIGSRRLSLKLSVPDVPTRLVDLLPVAQRLANAMAAAAEEDAVEQGETISCKKGCGACCRQLVPIAPVEARRLRELVNDMPEPRRTEVRRRFAAARERLHEAGFLEKLENREKWATEEVENIGVDYFHLGIACPFLEEESCSIHLDRPITCREYLATSPAEHCARPTRETVRTARIPLKVWPALARFELSPNRAYLPWVPLVLAPAWADSHPEDAPRPGPELLKEFFEHLSGKQLPPVDLGLASQPAGTQAPAMEK